MSTLRIDIELNEEEIITLAHKARGFLREEPRKRWSAGEYKEAARYRIQQLVREELKR